MRLVALKSSTLTLSGQYPAAYGGPFDTSPSTEWVTKRIRGVTHKWPLWLYFRASDSSDEYYLAEVELNPRYIASLTRWLRVARDASRQATNMYSAEFYDQGACVIYAATDSYAEMDEGGVIVREQKSQNAEIVSSGSSTAVISPVSGLVRWQVERRHADDSVWTQTVYIQDLWRLLGSTQRLSVGGDYTTIVDLGE